MVVAGIAWRGCEWSVLPSPAFPISRSAPRSAGKTGRDGRFGATLLARPRAAHAPSPASTAPGGTSRAAAHELPAVRRGPAGEGPSRQRGRLGPGGKAPVLIGPLGT